MLNFCFIIFKKDKTMAFSKGNFLLRYGFVQIKTENNSEDFIREFTKQFGYIRETNYGEIFRVESVSDASNLAYTPIGLSTCLQYSKGNFLPHQKNTHTHTHTLVSEFKLFQHKSATCRD